MCIVGSGRLVTIMSFISSREPTSVWNPVKVGYHPLYVSMSFDLQMGWSTSSLATSLSTCGIVILWIRTTSWVRWCCLCERCPSSLPGRSGTPSSDAIPRRGSPAPYSWRSSWRWTRIRSVLWSIYHSVLRLMYWSNMELTCAVGTHLGHMAILYGCASQLVDLSWDIHVSSNVNTLKWRTNPPIKHLILPSLIHCRTYLGSMWAHSMVRHW